MSTLDSRIDELYRGPFGEFVAARNALAKSLAGAERQRVAALQKPTALVWAVNQTYWRGRPVYDALLTSGKRLKGVQVSALKGRAADVRSATAEHRAAVAKAVSAASRLAVAAGLAPDTSALQQMFEAISLQDNPAGSHGRFVKPVQLSGFEALSGVPLPLSVPARRSAPARPADEDRARQLELKRAEEERRRKEAAITKAEARVGHASDDEQRARAAWEEARKALDDAKQALADLQRQS